MRKSKLIYASICGNELNDDKSVRVFDSFLEAKEDVRLWTSDNENRKEGEKYFGKVEVGFYWYETKERKGKGERK